MTGPIGRMKEVLDDWDRLSTFTSSERTPKRVAALKRAYEIEGSVDDWLENIFANLIEEYSKLVGQSFEAARTMLMERPIRVERGRNGK